ncbi:flagellar export protein FliJ [Nitrogeniibacter mangrovi]|uniref:Flagellar FliJ protein n=1 Tax=Nitrogeniibacter mangrovi TaxID=2016596 RepID=A0A6C1B108_9RHOO|nr:flagellar export protein FliJ [Nitrogeniibacter mangrovi]QID17257.1 flagellar export protein FliJ [Nitrogeniibacter mangrovi]
MTKPFPLQTLLDMANSRMDDAARRLGELIANETEDCRKLELLENYRAEYQAKFAEALRNGIDPQAMRNYSLFIGKLDEAIAAQRDTVTQSKQRTVKGQQAWMDQRTRAKAFDALSKRHQAKEARDELKREQRMTDEHASKQFRDRQSDDE